MQSEDNNKRDKRLRADIRKILSTPYGRRVLWRIWEECGIYLTSFNTESNSMAFNEGKRIIGLWLYNHAIYSDLEMVNRAQKESISEQIQEQMEKEKWLKAQQE